jgi:hypothetical protein
VILRFSDGLYLREVKMPAGSFVVGFEHKTEHFNVMLQGHLVMINEDGTTTDFIAPQTFSAPPGRKIAYIVEDVVWQNIFPANTRDIDELEDRLLNKSEDFKLTERQKKSAEIAEHEADRDDYNKMLERYNLTESIVRGLSENQLDQIPMPRNVHPYRIAESPIDGRGYFLTVGAKKGDILAPSRLNGNRTPAGRYVNHSCAPNARMQQGPHDSLYLVAIKDISGCMGGGIGTEITTDYGQTLDLLNISGDKLCQQQ